MKVVHICLANFFSDGYAYQENMLTKFHKQIGLEVEVIASLETFDDKGKETLYKGPLKYQNEFGILVTRLVYQRPIKVYRKLRRYIGLREALEESNPDILFIHGCQFLDASVVRKYIRKRPQIKVFVDNHADFGNSATNWVSKNILHKCLWRRCAKMLEPYTTRFYGVLPNRVDFLKRMYRLPEDKCVLLAMGADDDLVREAGTPTSRREIREHYGISENDFLIVTGGKINKYRPEVLDLLRAVIQTNRDDVKLLFFGTVDEQYKEEFDLLCNNPHIVYVGWIKAVETYKYIAAGDLVVFPGLHSVMWEQAVAQGKPCLFRDIEGLHHVDVGGNACFLKDLSISGLMHCILEIIDDPIKHENMKKVAEERGMSAFSYKEIAKRSIQDVILR